MPKQPLTITLEADRKAALDRATRHLAALRRFSTDRFGATTAASPIYASVASTGADAVGFGVGFEIR